MPYVLVPPLKSHEKAKFQPRVEPIPVVEKKSPAYRHQAPIEAEVDVDKIIQALKDQPKYRADVLSAVPILMGHGWSARILIAHPNHLHSL